MHVTFDCGIVHITKETLNSKIDVGILRSILMVTFGSMNCVVMEGSWVAHKHQYHTNVKKDRYVFWTVGFFNRKDEKIKNRMHFWRRYTRCSS